MRWECSSDYGLSRRWYRRTANCTCNHPDWCIHINGRKRSQWRHQLYLDLSRKEVQDYIIDSLSHVLSSANISYVKWDCNRRISEPGSEGLPPERQDELLHRYVLGLYHVMDVLTKRFPDVLFENCASGGARMDAGMMYYFPQTWASDNSDAVCRLKDSVRNLSVLSTGYDHFSYFGISKSPDAPPDTAGFPRSRILSI